MPSALRFDHSTDLRSKTRNNLIELTAEVTGMANTRRQTCKSLRRHSHYIYCPRSSSKPEDRQRPLFKSLLNSTYGPSLLTGLKTDCFSLQSFQKGIKHSHTLGKEVSDNRRTLGRGSRPCCYETPRTSRAAFSILMNLPPSVNGTNKASRADK